MAVDMVALVGDLAAESRDIERILAALPETGWDAPTPSSGWLVRDQVSHLAYFDETAALSATDPERFEQESAQLLAVGAGFADEVATEHRSESPDQLLDWLHRARGTYLDTFRGLDPSLSLPWYGPPMSAASSVTARLMETWAHGQDIVDAVGASRAPTARLRHIAHLGVATRGWSFRIRGLPVPEASVRVELTGPDGEVWTWGPRDATDRVTGSALDFCLLVTQRRHRSDTALRAAGPVAEAWIGIAQAFAGPPGPGRDPVGSSSPQPAVGP